VAWNSAASVSGWVAGDSSHARTICPAVAGDEASTARNAEPPQLPGGDKKKWAGRSIVTPRSSTSARTSSTLRLFTAHASGTTRSPPRCCSSATSASGRQP
jgi:hypothetical protein